MFKKKNLKKKNQNQPKPGTLLQPVKPITKQKNLAIVKPISQRILWMPKKYFDSQAAQPETGNLSL